ncbi:MAG: DUF4294 domain-containing protein [Bacteroidetes bacterium]|nr:DUF4294 domain-containing protein [Bacteroidota bacterium]
MPFKRIILTGLIFILSVAAMGQQERELVVYARIVDGDTIPVIPLRQVTVVSLKVIKNERQARKFTKLVRNVKKVYPYAKLAGIKLKEYEDILINAKDDKERRQIMKQAEEELKTEYSEDLKQLTFSQGKILIKLVDRETGNSSYDLVAELRGKFVAFFWQTFARMFGYNLKIKYDPEGEDQEIEAIVRLIESGEL